MKCTDYNKLVEGKRYRITFVDDVDWVDRKPIEKLKTYEGEFRGWQPFDPEDEEYMILFWIDGDSKAEFFCAGDFKEFELKEAK